MRDPLSNISPLDGRYDAKLEHLRDFFSEGALMKYRVKVEIEWFIFICNEMKLQGTKPWDDSQKNELRLIYENFDMESARRVKTIEQTTNHDVKAIEYFIKEKLKDTDYEEYLEFVHFACTSEDINNLSYALMLKDAMEQEFLPVLINLMQDLYKMSLLYKSEPMMSRTHGQPATPTTMGKELINFFARLERQALKLQKQKYLGKINGAVGNFNAHLVAYPKMKWLDLSKKFIQSLGLEQNLYTTQIEPHDYLTEIFDVVKHINTITTDLCRDMWSYVSLAYFKQKVKAGEVGSSTMPHKVNPIDFENSEGNLGIANALLGYFSEKLPISRLQRDLTDSTTLRNIGSAIGYSVLAYKNCIQGLGKMQLNADRLAEDLDNNWELLAEPLQTVMRKYQIDKPYEKLKELTRGKKVNKKVMQDFVARLKIPMEEKKRLKNLSPSQYIGLAVELVDNYKPQIF